MRLTLFSLFLVSTIAYSPTRVSIGDTEYFIEKFVGRGGTAAVHELLTYPGGEQTGLLFKRFFRPPSEDMQQLYNTTLSKLSVETLENVTVGSPMGQVLLTHENNSSETVTGYTMPKVAGRDLGSITENASRQGVKPQEVAKATLLLHAKIESVLFRMFEDGVIHRDIKPSNIMIDVDGIPSAQLNWSKLVKAISEGLDFKVTIIDTDLMAPAGYMAPVDEKGERQNSPGSLHYMDPRVIREIAQSESFPERDLYALEMGVWEFMLETDLSRGRNGLYDIYRGEERPRIVAESALADMEGFARTIRDKKIREIFLSYFRVAAERLDGRKPVGSESGHPPTQVRHNQSVDQRVFDILSHCNMR